MDIKPHQELMKGFDVASVCALSRVYSVLIPTRDVQHVLIAPIMKSAFDGVN